MIENFAPNDAEARRQGIGGSDAAAVAGVNPWKSAFKLWKVKTGEEPDDFEENDAIRWGNRLEPLIRKEAIREKFGVKVVKDWRTHHKPGHSWLYSHTDGRIVGKPWIAEIKTVGQRMAHYWDEAKDGVPDFVRIQCVHMMLVEPKLEGVEVYPLFLSDRDLRRYEIPKDERLEELYFQKAKQFWAKVLAKDPPDPATAQEFDAQLETPARGWLEGDEEVAEMTRRQQNLKRLEKEAKEELKGLALDIRMRVGDREGYLWPDGQKTRLSRTEQAIFDEERFLREQDADRFRVFDAKALRERDPALHAEYCDSRTVTRLLHAK